MRAKWDAWHRTMKLGVRSMISELSPRNVANIDHVVAWMKSFRCEMPIESPTALMHTSPSNNNRNLPTYF